MKQEYSTKNVGKHKLENHQYLNFITLRKNKPGCCQCRQSKSISLTFSLLANYLFSRIVKKKKSATNFSLLKLK